MDVVFMNHEDSTTSYLHRLLLNLSGKIDLKKSESHKNLKRVISNF